MKIIKNQEKEEINDNNDIMEIQKNTNEKKNNNGSNNNLLEKEKKNTYNKKHPFFGYISKYCPSPIELSTYIQYIIFRSKENKKLEVKFTVNEADSYIAKLAKEKNG